MTQAAAGAVVGAGEVTEAQTAAAFAALEKERATLGESELLRVNVDVVEVAPKVLTIAQQMKARADRFRLLPEYDHAAVDQLADRMLATLHAHNQYVAASGDGARVQALLEEAVPMRKAHLYEWGPVFVQFKVLAPELLATWREGSGHVDVANDLAESSRTFLARWDDFGPRTLLSRAQVERGLVVGEALLGALGRRDREVEIREARNALQRAFTLLVRAYDELRRGVSYFEWHTGLLDELAPSLQALRNVQAPAKKPEPAAPAA